MTAKKKSKLKSVEDKADNQVSQRKRSFSDKLADITAPIPQIEIILSIRHLALMLKSGISLSEAVTVLRDQVNNKRLSETYSKVVEDVESGLSLSESMKHFPNVFSSIVIAIVSVGESSGTLEKNLLFLADHLNGEMELKRKVRNALIYPAIVFGVTVLEMIGVLFFILPKMESLFSSFDNVPTFTVKLLDASNYIRSNIWMLLGIVAVFILVVVIFLRTKIGKKFTDRLGLSFPIVKNLTKKTILASFCRTLAVLLGSGIPISKSLKISTETIENYLYVEMIEDVYKNLNQGQALAASFKKYEKYFPPTLIKLIEAGEKTGTLEDNLMYLYDYYASEVDDMASNLTNLLEPILLVFIGAMIGLLAITIIAPVYQLTSSINQ